MIAAQFRKFENIFRVSPAVPDDYLFSTSSIVRRSSAVTTDVKKKLCIFSFALGRYESGSWEEVIVFICDIYKLIL